jgi:hypothetical protein
MKMLKSSPIRLTNIVGIALILALALGVMPALAQESIEKYKANALVQTAGQGSMAEINIYRWSSDAERDEIIQVIKDATNSNRRNRDVSTALRGLEKAGFAFLAGRTGYPLRYAREFKTDEGRQIVLATDRPVSFGEVYSQGQLGDFDTTIIVLKLDENGKGEGIVSVGTEVVWNDKTGQIEVTNVTSQPVKLTNVRMVK